MGTGTLDRRRSSGVTSIVVDPPVRRHRTRRAILIALGALVLYGAVSSLGIAFAVLVFLTVAVIVVWRHPGWTAVMLVALVPTNLFLILLVFHYGHSSALTSLAQLWKDLLIALLTFRTLDDLILRRRPKFHYVDALVAALLVL